MATTGRCGGKPFHNYTLLAELRQPGHQGRNNRQKDEPGQDQEREGKEHLHWKLGQTLL